MARRSTRRRRRPWWIGLARGELLDVRICDLELTIEGTALEARIQQLNDELARAGLRFRPHVWLSTDWFTPDGVTGFAIPFWLAHPRLARLEAAHMLEVEGGARDWCMKLLRHETAHALDNAYRLHWRKAWRETFGSFSVPYRDTYAPRPQSRDHVLNLDYWYAQSHPGEDWAETFAVWVRPGNRWRKRYAGWPALRKLEYVDRLMSEIASEPPKLRCRARPDSLPSLNLTLRDYYRQKRQAYHIDHSSEYDPFLRRIFSDETLHARRERAASFLARHYRELQSRVAAVTGQHPYLVRQVYNELLLRCRALGLRTTRPANETRLDFTVLLTTLTMSSLHGRHVEFRR